MATISCPLTIDRLQRDHMRQCRAGINIDCKVQSPVLGDSESDISILSDSRCAHVLRKYNNHPLRVVHAFSAIINTNKIQNRIHMHVTSNCITHSETRSRRSM
jgi:hypothetical protein